MLWVLGTHHAHANASLSIKVWHKIETMKEIPACFLSFDINLVKPFAGIMK